MNLKEEFEQAVKIVRGKGDFYHCVDVEDVIGIGKKFIKKALSQQREDTIRECIEKIGLDCPEKDNCGNQGTLSEHDIHCDGSPNYCGSNCPVPVQCEFCYTEPLSKFNIQSKLEKK